jgi:5-methylthioadenosine/S-adenosylhomocysteine deaminase
MKRDTLIYNGTILTVNADFHIIDNGYIGIGDGKILDIGSSRTSDPLPDAVETVDAEGGIILPGLVNTHTHLPMTLFRGLADDLPLMTWLEEHIFPAEGRYIDPETVAQASLLACAEMILSGTTTCCDGYFHEEDVAKAVESAGIRAVLGQGVVDFPAPGVPDPETHISHALTYIAQWRGRSPLISPSIFCHSPYTCSAETLKRAKAAAGDLLFQIHAAETEWEYGRIEHEQGETPIAYLDRLGILDERTLVIHSVWITEADRSLLRRRGAVVSHCPHSNMKLGSGVAPAAGIWAAGTPVGLGTDGCASSNTLDMFRAMEMTAKLHKVVSGDPTVMDAETVLRMATLGGAEALGLSHLIGSLERGKSADIVILNMAGPHLHPGHCPVSHLVYSAGGADIRDVLVSGKWLLRERRLQTVDWPAVRDAVRGMAAAVASGARP